MNRFKQRIANYDETLESESMDEIYKNLSYKYKTRLTDRVFAFAKESNQIENIWDDQQHMDAEVRLYDFMELDEITVSDLCAFNDGHGILRTAGQCVIIGNHIPPRGGQNILYSLEDILKGANDYKDAFDIHYRFETLHPFTDGNGRTGRALWLWQMYNQFDYNIEHLFLQEWYYHSLSMRRGV